MKKSNKPVPVSMSIGDRVLTFCENLTLVLVALKLAKVVDLTIWQVLSPMFVALGVPLCAGILLGIVGWIKEKQDEEGGDEE